MTEHIKLTHKKIGGEVFAQIDKTEIVGKLENGKIADISLEPHLQPYEGATIRVTIERQ
jgi:hypothetical protein